MARLAMYLKERGLYTQAEPLIRRALTIEEESGSDLLGLAICLNNLASLLHDTSCFSEAELSARRALQILEDCFGPNDPKVTGPLNNLAQLLTATNRLKEAEPLLRRTVEILGPKQPSLPPSGDRPPGRS
jgi:tetratricopeptide (TPR) repeat protein